MITPDQLAASGTEHGLQCAVFCWRNQQVKEWREYAETQCDGESGAHWRHLADKLSLMFAIPNGGERHAAVAGRLKAEGVKAGIPDIMLPTCKMPQGAMAPTHSGLFIELKMQKYRNRANGGLSNEQMTTIEALREQSYQVNVCYTWQEARDVVLQYLGAMQ